MVKEFQGCEYLVNTNGCITHKGNCKFCRQIEVKEKLIMLELIELIVNNKSDSNKVPMVVKQ